MNKEKGRGENRYRGLMVGIGTRGTDRGWLLKVEIEMKATHADDYSIWNQRNMM